MLVLGNIEIASEACIRSSDLCGYLCYGICLMLCVTKSCLDNGKIPVAQIEMYGSFKLSVVAHHTHHGACKVIGHAEAPEELYGVFFLQFWCLALRRSGF
jgi:hypothetical protein